MKSIYESVNKTIQTYQLDGIPKEEGIIHPHYNGYSIANLPASICRWLDVPGLSENAFAQEILDLFSRSYQHVVFLLIDGLRLDLFNRCYEETLGRKKLQEWSQLFQESEFFPLTSISPSTTSAAITTLWTGRFPAEHGIIGYELFLKEFGITVNMIFHSVASFNSEPGSIYHAGFNPSIFLTVETLGPHLRKHRVVPFAFQHASIASSGLSTMLLKDVTSIPFQTSKELWKSVQEMLLSQARSRTYSYIYWSELDTHSHRISPDSSEIYKEWTLLFQEVGQFLQNIRSAGIKNTLFILSADHGQIPTRIDADLSLFNHPEFIRHLVMLPTGESRLPYIFIKNGHENEVGEYLQSHWNRNFSMMPSEKVLSSGLLGDASPHQTTIDRIGSHVIFPRADAYWWWARKENHLLGRHGGLSDQEMLIPFLGLQL